MVVRDEAIEEEGPFEYKVIVEENVDDRNFSATSENQLLTIRKNWMRRYSPIPFDFQELKLSFKKGGKRVT